VATHGLARDLCEIDVLPAHRELAALHPREVEQVADETLESARFEVDRACGLVRAEHAFAEAFCVTADCGQRRLQLMADRKQEILPRPRATRPAARPSG